jgi:hypothetical protein
MSTFIVPVNKSFFTKKDIAFDKLLRRTCYEDGGLFYKINTKYETKINIKPSILSIFRQIAAENKHILRPEQQIYSRDFVIVLPNKERYIFGGDYRQDEEFPIFIKDENLFSKIYVSNAYLWYFNLIQRKEDNIFTFGMPNFIVENETFTICKKILHDSFPRQIFPLKWVEKEYNFVLSGGGNDENDIKYDPQKDIKLHVIRPNIIPNQYNIHLYRGDIDDELLD